MWVFVTSLSYLEQKKDYVPPISQKRSLWIHWNSLFEIWDFIYSGTLAIHTCLAYWQGNVITLSFTLLWHCSELRAGMTPSSLRYCFYTKCFSHVRCKIDGWSNSSKAATYSSKAVTYSSHWNEGVECWRIVLMKHDTIRQFSTMFDLYSLSSLSKLAWYSQLIVTLSWHSTLNW